MFESDEHFCKLRMISPTGLGIRMDSAGSGYYRAKRTHGRHYGTDYICVVGQPVCIPVSGRIVRVAYPYDDKKYSGILLENEFLSLKMFYLEPFNELIGQQVLRGQQVGYAQNIALKYGADMIPHIHVQIDHIDPNVFIRR